MLSFKAPAGPFSSLDHKDTVLVEKVVGKFNHGQLTCVTQFRIFKKAVDITLRDDATTMNLDSDWDKVLY